MKAEAVSDISKQRVEKLYPGLRPLAYRVLQDVWKATGRAMNVVQSLRTHAEQQALYAIGREFKDGRWLITDLRKIVTNARPGLSMHSYGLAFDCAWAGQDPYLLGLPRDQRDELWGWYGRMVKTNGLKWGGDFRLASGAADLPHAEHAFGFTIAECFELHERGGLDALWAHLDVARDVRIGDNWNRRV